MYNINALLVKEKYRRLGIATQLLKLVLNDYKYFDLELGVYQDNNIAIELYKKLGFKTVSEFEDNGKLFRMVRSANLPVINEIKYDKEIKPEVKAKFKVGDNVTLKDGLQINKVYQGVALTRFIYNDCYNKIMTIKEVIVYETGKIIYISDNGYYLSEEMLEYFDDWGL